MPVSCPFCSSRGIAETLHVKEMTKGTRDVFDYVVCASCGSPYISDFPGDISRYYDGYYSFSGTVLTMDRSEIKKTLVAVYARLVVQPGLSVFLKSFFRNPFAWQMKFLSPNLQAFLFAGAKADARILDVGCGAGQFVAMLRRFGYTRVTGVDPFLDAASGNGQVQRKDIHAVTGTYDLILFNHSLEHMTDPEAALNKCASILSPRGMVLVQVPNTGSPEFARFKQHWCWLHAPYHFAIPSRKGMGVMAERCGFQIADAVCTSRGDHYLYSDEYSRDISDRDPASARRELEKESFDKKRYLSLSRLAHSLNKRGAGDWICYYLSRSCAATALAA